jgi:hypothetical protein
LRCLTAELLAGVGKGCGEIAAAIVSHDSPMARHLNWRIGTRRHFPSSGRGIGPRYPGMVVDSEVDEFPASTLTAAIARAATSHAVAIAVEAARAGFGLAMKGVWRGALRVEALNPFGNPLQCGVEPTGAAPLVRPPSTTSRIICSRFFRVGILVGAQSVLRDGFPVPGQTGNCGVTPSTG